MRSIICVVVTQANHRERKIYLQDDKENIKVYAWSFMRYDVVTGNLVLIELNHVNMTWWPILRHGRHAIQNAQASSAKGSICYDMPRWLDVSEHSTRPWNYQSVIRPNNLKHAVQFVAHRDYCLAHISKAGMYRSKYMYRYNNIWYTTGTLTKLGTLRCSGMHH